MHARSLLVSSLLVLSSLTGCASSGAGVPAAGGMPTYATTGATFGGLSPALWMQPSPAYAFEEDEAEKKDHGFLFGVVMYIPNRIFDVFDMVRLRVRLGPGIAVGARATQVAEVYVGSYVSVWAGIHGSRGKPSIPWPVGLESRSGIGVSLADATVEGGIGPDYGPLEIGFDLQALLVGVAVGIEPWEMLDFVVGFLTFDPAHDDY